MTTAPPLRVGIVNAMPPSVRRATDRQFRALVLEAARGAPATFHAFRLDAGSAAHDGVAHATPARLDAAGLDALIVTGAEPQTQDLRQEPFWRSLAAVADWAASQPLASYWSCLAAHAAALHLDGVERRPLDVKLSGVFETCDPRRPETIIRSPHSRFNGVDEDDLLARGYVVRSRSPAVGVDAFIRPGPGLFLLHQGHPEYAPATLGQEWRRDLRRFLAGERPTAPDPPQDYFEPAAETALKALWRARDRSGAAACLDLAARAPVAASPWRLDAVRLFSSWLQASPGGLHLTTSAA